MAGWMMLIELLTKIDDLGWSGCGNTWSLHRIDCPPSTGLKEEGRENQTRRISHVQPGFRL